ALKVKVDYDTDMVSVLGEPWTTVLKGPKGEHLLALDDGMNEDTLVDYDFDYDFLADGVLHSLGDYLKQSGRVGPVFMDEIMLEEDEPTINLLDDNAQELIRENSNLTPAVERSPLPAALWKSIIFGINRSKNNINRQLETRTFDLPEWNFEDASHRRSFFELLEKEDLDVLQATRDFERHTHLLFVRRVFEVIVDQCALGAALPDAYGNQIPIKKATQLVVKHQLLTETTGVMEATATSAYYAHFIYGNSTAEEALPASDVDMEEYEPSEAPPEDDDLYPLKTAGDLNDIDLPTNKDIEAERRFFGRGEPRAEIDPTQSESTSAHPIAQPDPPQSESTSTHPVAQPDPPQSESTPTSVKLTGCLQKLECRTPAEAQRIVARLHRNLGHPNNRDLRVVLAQSGANRLVVETAENRELPVSHVSEAGAPGTGSKDYTADHLPLLNERLLSDTVWLQVLDKTVPVITMMDAATRYVAARVVRREASTDFLQALERGWIRVFGPPRTLFVDSHRAWGSDEVMRYVTEQGIELVISPGEAHERLAQLESEPLGGRLQPHAMGSWLYQPNIPDSLLDSNVNYSHLDPTEAFQHKMQCK
ncbi:GIP, partial [Symbiodinium necroappetens]